ncbi:Alpha- and gamma-adaptin-binding protein p34 [Ophiophagus hannah]|uniref:Alpha-and gamma-adaptin-binding protein p34 n=1 Tax=Ophiophagus hannah TaxID=8665 RepID=V8NKR6_OPHHA|nr:Alpha- and gamma-adaptin-binding protein p34 [Ophiophagus hannah]
MAVPCTLITSCAAGFPGEELVKRITGEEELPEHIAAESGARFYPWTIDNKYYSAAIRLCVVANVFQVTSEIAESIQAFLICFDSTTMLLLVILHKACSEEASYSYLLLQISGLDAVSQWLPLIEDWLPEVMILVCDRVSENGKATRTNSVRVGSLVEATEGAVWLGKAIFSKSEAESLPSSLVLENCFLGYNSSVLVLSQLSICRHQGYLNLPKRWNSPPIALLFLKNYHVYLKEN